MYSADRHPLSWLDCSYSYIRVRPRSTGASQRFHL